MLSFSYHEISKASWCMSVCVCVCVFIPIILVHHVSKNICILLTFSLLFITKFCYLWFFLRVCLFFFTCCHGTVPRFIRYSVGGVRFIRYSVGGVRFIRCSVGGVHFYIFLIIRIHLFWEKIIIDAPCHIFSVVITVSSYLYTPTFNLCFSNS